MTDDDLQREVHDLAHRIYLSTEDDRPMVVSGALLVYIVTDGNGVHLTGHLATDGLSPAAAIGLCELTRQYVIDAGGA